MHTPAYGASSQTATLSSKPLYDSSQYNELKKFQESCQCRGVYKPFKNTSDFKKQFENNLTIKLNDEYFKSNISNTVEIESKSDLSLEEKKLLKAASLDKDGIIHKVSDRAGTYIETNQIHIIGEQNAREVARWKSTLQSLLDKKLIKDIGNKGEVFEVTREGFDAADTIVD